MKNNLLEFLFNGSQQESEFDQLVDEELRQLIEQADAEETDSMQAEKSPLTAALKTIGLSSEGLQEDPEGFILILGNREDYVAALEKLSSADAMHDLAVKGWVAFRCGDQAQASEEPEYKIRFLEISTAEGSDSDKPDQSLEDIIKQAREFFSEEPVHNDDNPVEHSDPGKSKKVSIGTQKDGDAPEGNIKDSASENLVANLLENSRTLCECGDPGCPVCRGKCKQKAKMNLVRIDMDDRTGTMFCEQCGSYALDSGLFRENLKNFILR